MTKHKRYSAITLPRNILSFLLHEERRSSSLLLIAATTAFVLSNTNFNDLYQSFIHNKISLGGVSLDVKHWISEGLMSLFFLVVTLEVKRELIDGELRSWRKASFPVTAAIGGMLLPALIYTSINQYAPESNGWAVPIATDIAIAIGVLGLIGKRIPRSLRIFLLALAIIDDIGSIIIIGLFFNHPENAFVLIAAFTVIMFLVLFRRQRNWLVIFGVLGFILWYCFTLAGISGTMTGVILAVLAPLVTSRKNATHLQSSEKVEDILLPLTAYIIVPLFVFANAGLRLSDLSLESGSSLNVFAGVTGGLLIGKPVGIFAASFVSNLLGLSRKPAGFTWTQLLGVGFLAGIGFTVSLLIADLSFVNHALRDAAIAGVFTASILSSIIGVFILRTVKSRTIK
ncbi:Na+/H+ antiporter NhaA [Candidatus Saccharibacteria bacterium]|nr:Na+/H+ antiporter NhaA [Candidatus Saccharibacteria bacterium]